MSRRPGGDRAPQRIDRDRRRGSWRRRRARARPSVRRRRHDVVRRARLDRARPARRRRVRPSGDHGQAGAAGRLRRHRRSRRRPARHGRARGDVLVRDRRRRNAAVARALLRRAAGVGSHDVWIGAGDAPADRRGRPRAVGRRRDRRGPPRRLGGAASTTCCGSSPMCASSTPACSTPPAVRRATRWSASPAPTRAARRGARRRRRRPGHRADGRAARRRSTPALVAPVVAGDLVLVHAGTAIAVLEPTLAPMTDFLYPFLEGERRDVPRPCSPTWPTSAQGQGRRQRRAADARRWSASAASVEHVGGDRWPSASPPAAGCSRSATAAAPPTPRRWPPCSPRPRGAGRCRPAASSRTRAVLTALGNDVGFDLVFSRQLIAHARPR